MENDFSTYAPHLVGSAAQVTGNLFVKVLFDDFRKRFSPRRQEQRGDDFMDQTREILQTRLGFIPFDQQGPILRDYEKLRETRQRLGNESTSVLGFKKRLDKATEYKRSSRETYWTIKSASDTAIDNNLVARMTQNTSTRGLQVAPRNTFGTTSTHSNPFTDSHAISQLTNESVNDLNAVAMTPYETEGERAKKTNRPPGVAAAPSVHRENGTSSHLVSTPSPGDRTNKDAETRTGFSVAPTETPQVGPSGQ